MSTDRQPQLIPRPRQWASRPTLRSGVAVVLATGVFWLLSGAMGVLLGVGLGAALVVLPEILVFALAQVVVAVVLPADPSIQTVIGTQLPLFLLLWTALAGPRQSWRQESIAILLGGGVIVVSIVTVAVGGRLWVAALSILVVTAAITYGIHRYTVVIFDHPDHE